MKVFALLLGILAIISSVMAFKNEICGLPHSANGYPGNYTCPGHLIVWTYDQQKNDCILFTYGGCGGNANNFDLGSECRAMCKE